MIPETSTVAGRREEYLNRSAPPMGSPVVGRQSSRQNDMVFEVSPDTKGRGLASVPFCDLLPNCGLCCLPQSAKAVSGRLDKTARIEVSGEKTNKRRAAFAFLAEIFPQWHLER